jgi:prevent-host-death family protein
MFAMPTVTSEEAETHLPRLLERVERGETIIITRHGRAVARLVSATLTAPQPEIVDVIEAMRAFQEQEAPTLGNDLSIRDLISEGRRF